MSIRVETADLVDLLTLLLNTASSDREDGVTAGILLHTTRGERGTEPGRSDMLVGTSTDRFATGHTNVIAYGQLARPTLWGIDDVKAVIATFKSKAKRGNDDEGHQVLIDVDLGHVNVSEDPNLFEDGVRLSFHESTVDDFPRRLWHVLSHVDVDAYIAPGGIPVAAANRTDIGAARLAPFTKVASKLGSPIQVFRTHQNRYLLVQIGEHYRGAIAPIRWDLDTAIHEGDEPSADVHAPDLPPALSSTTKPAKLFTPRGVQDQAGVITGFPGLQRDTRELGRAADIVVSGQSALPTLLMRGLRISSKRAEGLLQDLSMLGVVGPATGLRVREVLVGPEQLDAVLTAIAELKSPEVGGSFQLVDEETEPVVVQETDADTEETDE